MKIVVTGATGFVGQNLVKYINNAGEVHAASRAELLHPQNLFNGRTYAVVHLAGKAHDLKKTSRADEYYDVNFELTKKLYNAFLASEAQKFIFISSVKAAADVVTGALSENTPANPVTHYGRSKLMAEDYIRAQPLPPGKSYFILRPCMIHGPGNKGNLNLLYKLVKKNIPYPLAGFSNKRSFLSVQNLCFVIKELLLSDDIPFGIYNVADDEALSTNEVISVLSLSLNKKPKLWKIAPVIIKIAAQLGDVMRLPLTTERLTKLTESYVVNNKKIKDALGKPLPLTAKQGLKIAANSFKEKG